MARKKRRSGRYSSISSGISTTMVLILLGIIVFFVMVANNFSIELKQNFTIELLLRDNLSNQDLQRLNSQLKTAPFCSSVRYLSKEEGTKEMTQALKSAPAQFLGYNPIPAEFEVNLKADYANLDSLKKYTALLRTNPEITDIIYPKDAMTFVNYVIPLVGGVLLVIALLLAFVSFSLINNTIRMSIYARRFNIHTMKLVGASWGFIRKPFLKNAFCIGFIAATVASLLLGTGMYYLLQIDIYVTRLITLPVIVVTIGTIYLCGLLLTVLCAYFCINKYLKMSAGELFMK